LRQKTVDVIRRPHNAIGIADAVPFVIGLEVRSLWPLTAARRSL
jgi:hypothetical protein